MFSTVQLDLSMSVVFVISLVMGFLILALLLMPRSEGSGRNYRIGFVRAFFLLIAISVPASMLFYSSTTISTAETSQGVHSASSSVDVDQAAVTDSQDYREETIQILEEALTELDTQDSSEQTSGADSSPRVSELRNHLESKLEKLKHPEQNYPRWITEAGPKALTQLEQSGVQKIPTFNQQMIVSSGRWVTREEAHQEAIDQAKHAIFEQISSPGETPEISIEQLNSFILDEYVEDFQLNLKDSSIQADMYRCHLLLDLSPAQLATLMPDVRKSALEKRLAIAGGALLSIMTFAGLASFVMGRK